MLDLQPSRLTYEALGDILTQGQQEGSFNVFLYIRMFSSFLKILLQLLVFVANTIKKEQEVDVLNKSPFLCLRLKKVLRSSLLH